ncbi:unnamed protein product [Heligmosomoides polygyrus]|uniref:Ovule protein n=1 Tax=Heligmosomoides polygyrus TaxID=6339 RepID=A0A183FUU6_HELPZ|nr:unnamed protein product [Heligmosomoides polygyrus]
MPSNGGFLSDTMDTRVLINGGVAVSNRMVVGGAERSSSDLESIISIEDDSMGHCHGSEMNLDDDPSEVSGKV